MSGNSVAVRLPRGLGVAANSPFIVERRGSEIILRREDDPESVRAAMRALAAELLSHPPTPQVREPIEFPDRA